MEKHVTLLCLILAIASCASAFAIRRSRFERSQPLDHSLANNTEQHSFIILGATGDLARRKIYPSLWYLFQNELLPAKTIIYGYARSPMSKADLRQRVEPYINVKPGQEARYEEFWGSLNRDVVGSKNPDEGYNTLCSKVQEAETDKVANRNFYLALPPAVFESSAAQVKRACMAPKGRTRLVVEKPFGQDLESSEVLQKALSKLFTEDQVYRIDHYLGYEMVQNLLALRFGNRMLYADWDKNSIASVEVDFKQNLGIEGRGAFFDPNGIIRDVMQNHLLQILSLIAMEKPVSSQADDIRDQKVKLLQKTREIEIDDVVLGQYVGNPDSPDPREHLGYTEESTVPKDSLQSTFAMTVLKIDNERWDGVPFIIRAGKGLNINQTQVIIQFKDIEEDIFNGESKRNKLIITLGKKNSLEANLMSKTPGFSYNLEEITLNFHYDDKHKELSLPDAYERLILDVFRGSQRNFVRSDELREAWRVFTPILHKIESSKLQPHHYTFGTTGPKEADELEKKYNFL